MSLFPIKFVRRYWSPRSRIGIVADKIALADFLDIKKHLHFVDNTKLGTGKLRKVQPIIDRFNVVSRSIEPEEYCSIDENTLPYKGKRSTLRQYKKNTVLIFVTKIMKDSVKKVVYKYNLKILRSKLKRTFI